VNSCSAAEVGVKRKPSLSMVALCAKNSELRRIKSEEQRKKSVTETTEAQSASSPLSLAVD